MVLEDHRVPSIQFQIIMIGAGGYYDPTDLPGLADTTASLMDEGTTTKTSEQIAQALDTMAASVSVSANEGSQIATLTGSALTDQFDQVLALAADILLQPELPGERARALQGSRARGPRRAAERSGLSCAESATPRRSTAAIRPRARASRTNRSRKSRAMRWSRSTRANYVPDHAIIGVSGDITLAEARTKFEAALKAWAKCGQAAAGRGRSARQRPVEGLARQSAGFGADRLSCSGEQAINRTDPDYDALQVMNTDPGRIQRPAVPRAARAEGLHLRRVQLRCARCGIAATGARRWMCAPK